MRQIVAPGGFKNWDSEDPGMLDDRRYIGEGWMARHFNFQDSNLLMDFLGAAKKSL